MGNWGSVKDEFDHMKTQQIGSLKEDKSDGTRSFCDWVLGRNGEGRRSRKKAPARVRKKMEGTKRVHPSKRQKQRAVKKTREKSSLVEPRDTREGQNREEPGGKPAGQTGLTGEQPRQSQRERSH